LALVACKKKDSMEIKESGKVIASIGDKNLYLSDLGDIKPTAEGQDSVQLVEAYIDNWLRNNAILIEAERSYSDNENLDKLVREYRNSLMIYDYEGKVIEERLDTIVTQAQIKEVYDKYGDQYLIGTKLIKFWFAKAPEKTKKIDQFYVDWKKGNRAKVEKFCEEKKLTCLFEDVEWDTERALLSLVDQDVFKSSQLVEGATLIKNKNGNEYFLKIIDLVPENSVPPMEYIESKIRKVIINNRKKEILQNLKDNLYKKQLNANKVKIYRN